MKKRLGFKKRLNKSRGITLIALVITIIVLLILATVTILALTGENGLFTRAKQARDETTKEQIIEQFQLAIGGLLVDYTQTDNAGTFRDYIFSTDTGKGQEKLKAELGENNLSFDITNYQITYKGIVFNIDENGAVTTVGETVPTAGEITGTELAALSANGMKELKGDDITTENLKDNDNIRAVITGQIPIPAGYTYLKGTATSETSLPAEGSWGVVIKDGNSNEWVWVPVNAVESIAPTGVYESFSPSYLVSGLNKNVNKKMKGIKIASIGKINGLKIAALDSESDSDSDSDSGSESEDSIKTLVSKKSASEIINGMVRNRYISAQHAYFREPSINTSDFEGENYTKAGFSSVGDMADKIVKDYDDMIESITKYGGFYVGRYELSGTRVGLYDADNFKIQANQNAMSNIDWYKLYKANRSFATSATTSTMIWGAQWDIVCLWSSKVGDRIAYNSYQANRHTGDWDSKTGTNSNDVRNNVYDIEGSRLEFTQEAYDVDGTGDSDGRLVRGGCLEEGDTMEILGRIWCGRWCISIL